MIYQFCPSQCWEHLRRVAARTNAVDLALLALLVAFGLGMCLTLASDTEIAFEDRFQAPAGKEIVVPVSGSRELPHMDPIGKSRIKM